MGVKPSPSSDRPSKVTAAAHRAPTAIGHHVVDVDTAVRGAAVRLVDDVTVIHGVIHPCSNAKPAVFRAAHSITTCSRVCLR